MIRLQLEIYNSILQLQDWDTLQWGNQDQAPPGNIQLHITAAGLGYFTVGKSGSGSTWKYTTAYYSCRIGILYSGEIRIRLHLEIYNSILQLQDWDTLQWGNQNQAQTGNIQLHITAAGLGYFTVGKSGSGSNWIYTTPYYSCRNGILYSGKSGSGSKWKYTTSYYSCRIGILYSVEIRIRLQLEIYNCILQLQDWDTLQWGNQDQAPPGNIQLHITDAGLGYFTVGKSGSGST
ncbi:hypothetical protein DPMN_117404 [Dreissena polymorpha]|uniref:Uncharacterized protein n=1 Tax=Dreissena polymorpha TaxID=45954 RepID=A0A9D4QU99_DREPO|nr:hypothetical protein DPMN_117404 [Dreissena polymorpha]